MLDNEAAAALKSLDDILAPVRAAVLNLQSAASQQLADKESENAGLSMQVSARDAAIASKDAQLKDRDAAVASLSAQLQHQATRVEHRNMEHDSWTATGVQFTPPGPDCAAVVLESTGAPFQSGRIESSVDQFSYAEDELGFFLPSGVDVSALGSLVFRAGVVAVKLQDGAFFLYDDFRANVSKDGGDPWVALQSKPVSLSAGKWHSVLAVSHTDDKTLSLDGLRMDGEHLVDSPVSMQRAPGETSTAVTLELTGGKDGSALTLMFQRDLTLY